MDWERVQREREERELRAAARAREERERGKKGLVAIASLAIAALTGALGWAIDRRALFVASLQAAGVGLAVLLVYVVEQTSGRGIEELDPAPRSVVRGLALLLMVAPALAFFAWAAQQL
ncbi:hypothetical protein [Sandaracinus amylolyticus]|uniref:hypothetical protein n=1 Tax=Sandaracinus amylolyticus TaxID=927083 RepID=UPI001F4498AE|nr:hypothetical protein [Sandaracinus amylolyticus]